MYDEWLKFLAVEKITTYICQSVSIDGSSNSDMAGRQTDNVLFVVKLIKAIDEHPADWIGLLKLTL